jgi:hypothetical protein
LQETRFEESWVNVTVSGVGISDIELSYIEFIYIHYCNKWKKKMKQEKCVQMAEPENSENGLATKFVLFVTCVN